MLNVTKKLKLFVIYTVLLSMIWLRLFIAVIALTISSDLSAWAQPQMQVNSPEGFYDCNGIANGTNQRDIEQKCCLPSQQTFAGHCKRCAGKKECEDVPQFGCFTAATKDINGTCCFDNQKDCGKCYYKRQGCESFPGRGCGQIAQGECSCDLSIKKVCDKCNYTMQGCESVRGCGNIDTVCGSCTGTMGGCGRCSGCRSCDVSRCQDPGTGVNPAYQCSGSDRLGHGVRAVRIDHISPVRGSRYLYSTDPDAEGPLKPGSGFNHSRTNYICNDGNMVPN